MLLQAHNKAHLMLNMLHCLCALIGTHQLKMQCLTSTQNTVPSQNYQSNKAMSIRKWEFTITTTKSTSLEYANTYNTLQ